MEFYKKPRRVESSLLHCIHLVSSPACIGVPISTIHPRAHVTSSLHGGRYPNLHRGTSTVLEIQAPQPPHISSPPASPDHSPTTIDLTTPEQTLHSWCVYIHYTIRLTHLNAARSFDDSCRQMNLHPRLSITSDSLSLERKRTSIS